jgi:hypothetical protein
MSADEVKEVPAEVEGVEEVAVEGERRHPA